MNTNDWAKYERQMNLLAALYETSRPMRLAEIIDSVRGFKGDFEAARKMFIRDRDELVALGVPIETVPGASAEETGYRIDRERYELPDLDLEPEELAALHLALETLNIGVTDGQVDRALWRLGGIVDDDRPVERVDRVLGEMRELPSPPDLLTLVRAAADRCVVRFAYETSAGTTAERAVEPWHVGFERGRWYLHGHDRDRGDARNYRLDRIRGAVTVGRPGTAEFEPPPVRRGTADPWEYGDGDPVMVELRLDPAASVLASASLGSYASRTEGDGSTVWTVPVTNWPAFRSFVLSFLDRAEILAPPAARAEMAEWLASVAGEEG